MPFRRPYVTAAGTASHRYLMLVQLRADTGLVGLGEASAIGPGNPEALERLGEVMAFVATRLLGLEVVEALEGLPSLLPTSRIDSTEPSPVRFGLETAMYDLIGKDAGVSLSVLLGAVSRRVGVNATVAEESLEGAVTAAVEAVGRGFGTLKLKVGSPNIESDVALVGEVRGAVGPHMGLRLDANGAWCPEQAVEAIRRVEHLGIEYVEQPVMGVDALAEVRSATRVPVAADEMVTGFDAAAELLTRKAVDVVVVKAARVGGLRQAVRIIRHAAREGIPAVVTTALESGVGVAAALHLAALARTEVAHGLATAEMLASDLLVLPLLPDRGVLVVPSGPGLGVELGWEEVVRYRMDVSGEVGH